MTNQRLADGRPKCLEDGSTPPVASDKAAEEPEWWTHKYDDVLPYKIGVAKLGEAHGGYTVGGLVNNQVPVTFTLDSGATLVVLPRYLLRRRLVNNAGAMGSPLD